MKKRLRKKGGKKRERQKHGRGGMVVERWNERQRRREGEIVKGGEKER